MKSILIISPYFYPEGGGLENYAFQVAQRLIGLGHKITIACLAKQNKIKDLNNLKIYRFKYDFAISNTPIKLGFIFKILKIINTESIDIIHAHTPVPFAVDMAALASKIKNLPLIITYHANTLFKGNQWTDTIAAPYLLIQHLTLKRAGKIIAVLNNSDKFLKHWNNKISVIPPGVDLNMFSFSDYPHRSRNILLISPLSKAYPSKGVDTLFQAIKLIKEQMNGVKAQIAGNGDLIGYYQLYASKLGIEKNIEFLGKKNYSDMPDIYKQSNVLVVPSIKSEGTPTVILEAMATGRPVIGTIIGGIPDLIENKKNGLLVKSREPKALAEKILEIFNNSELAESMGKQGRSIAEQKYSWKKITNQYEKIIRNIK